MNYKKVVFLLNRYPNAVKMAMQKVFNRPKTIDLINGANYETYSSLKSLGLCEKQSAAIILASKLIDLTNAIGVEGVNKMTPNEILTEVSGGVLN